MHKSHSDKTINTNLGFGLVGWMLAVGVAVIWGSSFLLIDMIIDDAPSYFVPFGRSFCGALALLFVPGARQPIAREHRGRLWLLGLIWMALPFFLFPLAEQSVDSNIAGMLNGALPIVLTVVTAFWVRALPSAQQVIAVIVGLLGITLITVPSLYEGTSADGIGIIFLLIALLCYAVGLNIARPLQAIYSPAQLMFNVVAISTVWSAPFGLIALRSTRLTFQLVSATVLLGALGSGVAFLMFAILLKRTGSARAIIPTYFTPIVGIFLGVLLNGENLIVMSGLGMAVVLLGAWLTSRPTKVT